MTPADVLMKIAAMRRAPGQPLPFGVPGGGGQVDPLNAEERDALKRLIEAMGRQRGLRLPELFG